MVAGSNPAGGTRSNPCSPQPSWGFCFSRVEPSRLLAQTFDPRAWISGNTEVSGAGPGPPVPTPYPILTAGSILLPTDDASCHPASQVNGKSRKAVSPGHGLHLRASHVIEQPCGAPIRAAWPPPSRQEYPGSVRGRTGITAPAAPGIAHTCFTESCRRDVQKLSLIRSTSSCGSFPGMPACNRRA